MTRSSKIRVVMPNCRLHTKTKMICPACVGAAGGAHTAGVTTPAKARSSARNGRLGGRPPNHSPECDVQTTGRYTEDCPRCQYDARKFSADEASQDRRRRKKRPAA